MQITTVLFSIILLFVFTPSRPYTWFTYPVWLCFVIWQEHIHTASGDRVCPGCAINHVYDHQYQVSNVRHISLLRRYRLCFRGLHLWSRVKHLLKAKGKGRHVFTSANFSAILLCPCLTYFKSVLRKSFLKWIKASLKQICIQMHVLRELEAWSMEFFLQVPTIPACMRGRKLEKDIDQYLGAVPQKLVYWLYFRVHGSLKCL